MKTLAIIMLIWTTVFATLAFSTGMWFWGVLDLVCAGWWTFRLSEMG